MKTKMIIMSTLMFLGLHFTLGGAISSASPATEQINAGKNQVTGIADGNATTDVNSTIRKVINIITSFGGILAVMAIVFAGYKYITSGGDSSKVSSAKNMLIYAAIGIAVIAAAQIIVRFVINNSDNNPRTSYLQLR